MPSCMAAIVSTRVEDVAIAMTLPVPEIIPRKVMERLKARAQVESGRKTMDGNRLRAVSPVTMPDP